MLPMSREPRPRSVATPSVLSSCPICGTPLQGKQTVCSTKCRIQRSMRRRAVTQAERDAQVRLLLTEALGLLEQSGFTSQ